MTPRKQININTEYESDILEVLLEKSLQTPDGWSREVFVDKKGDISFSELMTHNSSSAEAYYGSKEYVCNIEASSWEDWEYKTFSNGQVAPRDGLRVGKKEAIQNIVSYYSGDHFVFDHVLDEIKEVYKKLQQQEEEV
ncbi:MAG: hypothetical protein FWD52_07970 [Candidatus Bathyarchaeota archaeon]|nr:hypothetical protein [Candidatus Termiticorpusculum sp.]